MGEYSVCYMKKDCGCISCLMFSTSESNMETSIKRCERRTQAVLNNKNHLQCAMNVLGVFFLID